MTRSGFDINNLFQEAQSRWLKPAEVLFILQNHERYQLTLEAPRMPTGGSLFLFNKRVLRFFRKDGHNWRKKKDGRTVGEAHERLKVGNVEALNCYYAHGEQNPNFQRRSYWMLDQEYEHIVLVHYREINEGNPSPASIVQSPGSSSGFSPAQNSNTSHNLVVTDAYESSSPGSVEVSSETVIENNRLDSTGYYSTSSAEIEVNQALRRLEQQLSLNDDSFEEVGPFESQEAQVNESEISKYVREISKQDQHADMVHGSKYIIQGQLHGGYGGMHNHSRDFVLLSDGGKREQASQPVDNIYVNESKGYWNNVLESCKSSSGFKSVGKPLSSSIRRSSEEQQPQWLSFNGSSIEELETLGTNSDDYTMLFNEGEIGTPLEDGSSLTVAKKQKFTIREISPEWGFSDEHTKVIIIGSFLCNPSESAWACMFGEVEVPLQIIQEGVICCEAPPHLPGKVTLCITSGNRESCSELRQFDYRNKNNGCDHCNLSPQEILKSTEELLLLVRFVQMLFSDKSFQKEDNINSGIHILSRLKDDDSWSHVIEDLLVGSGSYSGTINWLLQELLKEKLQQWLSSRSTKTFHQTGCPLSKKEQGIIHMVAGLGFEWALNPILSCGVGVNFRDIRGWTALHWAARFGREKMVASLLASGASAGAVTDPNAQDPRGQTPAYIAASVGHKGLAGYLSEVALTSHLSSLVLEESKFSKGSAEVEAERTVNSISQGTPSTSEDQLSLKDTLAAVRNATQAAARIQNAFRAHSFRKRQQGEAALVGGSIDEYGINSDDVKGLSALSRLAFGNAHDCNLAALSIQKKYRGWKSRKDFLALRQKVVKIQAHVRGYQVRKNKKAICWAVGFLDKVVLRWRRKGVGLRGFRQETAPIDENEEEDILKGFRRQKVDATVDEAVSRVLSMVDSPEARQQYRRMLERYREAKAELGSTSEAETPTSAGDVSLMEDDEVCKFM